VKVPKIVDRTSEVSLNKRGFEMIVEEYNGSGDMLVRFSESGNLVKTTYQSFKNGSVKNVYDKNIYGVGYFGEGEYKGRINGKLSKVYNTWVQMIHRCYSEYLQKKQPAYIGCSVAEEWHNFQNFAKWYDENYYEIEVEMMCLDKDILVKGNKHYSPETCIFVPKAINNLFIRRSVKTLPIGVSKFRDKYQAYCHNPIDSKLQYLGVFDISEEAFNAYKSYKEQIIKEVAESYKSRIPVTLYDALTNYKVEITD
jgi:hypothetical protein